MNQDPITAAKEAFSKITTETDRLSFIDWCRRENDKALFRTIDFAEQDAMDELKAGISNGLEKLGDASKRVQDAASGLPDMAKKASTGLDDLMNKILNGGKKLP